MSRESICVFVPVEEDVAELLERLIDPEDPATERRTTAYEREQLRRLLARLRRMLRETREIRDHSPP